MEGRPAPIAAASATHAASAAAAGTTAPASASSAETTHIPDDTSAPLQLVEWFVGMPLASAMVAGMRAHMAHWPTVLCATTALRNFSLASLTDASSFPVTVVPDVLAALAMHVASGEVVTRVCETLEHVAHHELGRNAVVAAGATVAVISALRVHAGTQSVVLADVARCHRSRRQRGAGGHWWMRAACRCSRHCCHAIYAAAILQPTSASH